MRQVTELLAGYAACHRDRRAIATHLVGVPTIVFAVAVLLSRPAFALGGLSLTPTWLATGTALFAVGWAIPFVGHWYERRKRAFVDDLTGLLIGPMFVVAAVLYQALAGWASAGSASKRSKPL